MDGLMDKWMGGWMYGQMDAWMDQYWTPLVKGVNPFQGVLLSSLILTSTVAFTTMKLHFNVVVAESHHNETLGASRRADVTISRSSVTQLSV